MGLSLFSCLDFLFYITFSMIVTLAVLSGTVSLSPLCLFCCVGVWVSGCFCTTKLSGWVEGGCLELQPKRGNQEGKRGEAETRNETNETGEKPPQQTCGTFGGC